MKKSKSQKVKKSKNSDDVKGCQSGAGAVEKRCVGVGRNRAKVVGSSMVVGSSIVDGSSDRREKSGGNS